MITHHHNLDLSVVSELNSFTIDFKIYDQVGYHVEGTPLFHKKGSASYPDFVYTIEESEPILTGTVKWDGCSDWNFTNNCYHGCNRVDITRFGEIMGICWDFTKVNLLTFNY